MIGLSVVNEQLGEGMYQLLNPGATLLAKWLPVFFVPSLIMLPLASGLGTVWEVCYLEETNVSLQSHICLHITACVLLIDNQVAKVFSVIIGGFLFTLFTSAWSVLGIRKLMNNVSSDGKAFATATVTTQPQSKAFSKTLFRTLKLFAWISGMCTVVQIKNSPSSKFINLLQSSFLLFVTLSSFVFGANLPTSFTKVVHPLVTCTSLTWLAAKLLSQLTGSSFLHVLRSYKFGTLSPLSAEVWVVKYPEVQVVKYPEVRVVQYPEVRVVKYPEVWVVKYLEVRVVKYPEVREVKYPEVWVVRVVKYPEVWVVKYPEVWVIKYPEVQVVK
jgi:hypothetical protein